MKTKKSLSVKDRLDLCRIEMKNLSKEIDKVRSSMKTLHRSMECLLAEVIKEEKLLNISSWDLFDYSDYITLSLKNNLIDFNNKLNKLCDQSSTGYLTYNLNLIKNEVQLKTSNSCVELEFENKTSFFKFVKDNNLEIVLENILVTNISDLEPYLINYE